MHRCGYLQRQRPTPQVERDHHWVHRKCLGFNSWKYISPCVGNVCNQLSQSWWRTTARRCHSHLYAVLQHNMFHFVIFTFSNSCAVSYSPFFQNLYVKKGAHKPGMWACSGEIHATSHLLQCHIVCFGLSSSSGKHGWSWYPSARHWCTNNSSV